MDVTKSTVEQFTISKPHSGNLLEPQECLTLDRVEALDVFDKLREALGMPSVKYQGCGDRYSHGPHARELNGEILICRGHAFDQT